MRDVITAIAKVNGKCLILTPCSTILLKCCTPKFCTNDYIGDLYAIFSVKSQVF